MKAGHDFTVEANVPVDPFGRIQQLEKRRKAIRLEMEQVAEEAKHIHN